MHRPRDIFRAKEKVTVRLTLQDGAILTAQVFPGGTERVLDLINNGDMFLPIEIDGHMQLINKNIIKWVTPDDSVRMGME